MVQFIFLKCNWRKGAKSIPKANLRCNFKLRVDFQESDKYLQRTRAHVRSSVLRWLGHLENSTASQPPTELRTRICTTRIKLLRTGLGPEVWGGNFKNSLNQMAASFIDILLLSWIHDVVEPKYFFLIIFSLDIDGCIVGLNKKLAT